MQILIQQVWAGPEVLHFWQIPGECWLCCFVDQTLSSKMLEYKDHFSPLKNLKLWGFSPFLSPSLSLPEKLHIHVVPISRTSTSSKQYIVKTAFFWLTVLN